MDVNELTRAKGTTMKRFSSAILAMLTLIASGSGVRAQTLSKADLDRGLISKTTKKNIVDATRGLSEAQWNFRPRFSNGHRPGDGAHSRERRLL
jgi:hypothetical protein